MSFRVTRLRCLQRGYFHKFAVAALENGSIRTHHLPAIRLPIHRLNFDLRPKTTRHNSQRARKSSFNGVSYIHHTSSDGVQITANINKCDFLQEKLRYLSDADQCSVYPDSQPIECVHIRVTKHLRQ
jgi:hypothetical protein